ncbi:MAG TPA: hypothetical protein VFA50_01025 [Stellaceae bacterium]|nr:hypothetical protein [Stellaceae bacterium]
MERKSGECKMGMSPLDSLLAWWGLPASLAGNGAGAPLARLQAFGSELQSIYADASRRALEAVISGNDRLAGIAGGMIRSRTVEDVAAIQSEIFAIVLEGASQQARIWSEAAQRVRERCAALAPETPKATRASESEETTAPRRAAASRQGPSEPVEARKMALS